MADERSDAAGYLGWFLLGGVLGAAAALLMAPRTGRETRELLAEHGGDVARRAQALATEAQDRAGDCRGDFPAEEFLADVIVVGKSDAHDRMAGAFECIDGIVLLRIRLASQAHIDKQAIRPIDLRRTQGLGIDRDHSLAQFPRRLGKKLLKPGTEIADARRSDDGNLVAPGLRQNGQDGPEYDAWIVCGGHTRSTGAHHFLRRPKQPPDAEAHRCGRHHAEVRQHRIPAAYARLTEQDVSKSIALADLLELRSRIRDGHEA